MGPNMKQTILGFVLLTGAVAFGCQSIAGIEDRTYDLDTAESQASEQCKEYCTTVMANCTGTNKVYSTKETCYGVCAKLPPGEQAEPYGNTVLCRLNEAKAAGDPTAGEPKTHCPAAGPGGNSPGAGENCGTNCEAYCYLMQRVCPKDYESVPDCVDKCAALKDTGSFDVAANHSGDTLQCRLVHVSSATGGPAANAEHCPHARFRPTDPWCVEKDPPQCADYCRVQMAACTGDLKMYESPEQCAHVCAVLPKGSLNDQTADTDTIGCRLYHSYSSLAEPQTHCFHTGPGGDGHCSTDNCPSYCLIVQAACGNAFDTKYPGGTSACQTDCRSGALEATSKKDAAITVANALTAAKKPFGCRMLHAMRALDLTAASEDPSAECTLALGGGDCQ